MKKLQNFRQCMFPLVLIRLIFRKISSKNSLNKTLKCEFFLLILNFPNYCRALRHLAVEKDGYLQQKSHPMVKPTLRVMEVP